MIVRSTFRRPGGLASHLLRADTNESVLVHQELTQGCALDVREALSDFAAIGHGHGVDRSMIHFVVSPPRALTEADEARMIQNIRGVYNIEPDHPMIAVVHDKPGETDRDVHYHFVLPRRDPATGRLVSDKFSHIKNERLGLEIAHDLGMGLVPGPNLKSVVATLERERPDMRQALASLVPPSRVNDRTTSDDKALAHQHGVSLKDFDRRVFGACIVDNKLDLDPAQLDNAGFTLAHGDRAVLIVDANTGFSQSLSRTINRQAKRVGVTTRVKERDIASATSGQRLKEFDHAAAVAAAANKSVVDIDRTLRAARNEAARDFDIGCIRKVRHAQESEDDLKVKLAARKARTIKSDLSAIRERVRIANDLRFRAVQRARRHARFLNRHRRMIGLVAGAAGLAVGGLPIGVMAMIVARGAVAANKVGTEQVKATRIDIKAETARYFEQVRTASRFDLNSIPKEARSAAGAIYQASAVGREADPKVAAALDKVVPGLSVKISGLAVEYR